MRMPSRTRGPPGTLLHDASQNDSKLAYLPPNSDWSAGGSFSIPFRYSDLDMLARAKWLLQAPPIEAAGIKKSLFSSRTRAISTFDPSSLDSPPKWIAD